MDLFDTFAVDEKKLQDGVWWVIDGQTEFHAVEESEIGEQPAVLLASMHSPKYRKSIEAKQKVVLMRRGDIDSATRERMMNEAIAECVILDWKNFVVQNVTMKYSRETVLEFLNKPQWVRLRVTLMLMVNEEQRFQAVQEREIAKNS